MRRKIGMRPSRRNTFIYICALIAMLAYGIPRIPALKPGLAGSFSAVWILFCALAIAANVYFFVGADKERSRMLEELDADKDDTSSAGSAGKKSAVSR
ncbi:hypothetical protein [Alicyclobacillus sp. SO9]|uniref:hypothetical protein n=1 Tax=Alicyclobacillus sp. SO9 TaxID=2665646 RepID=UPI0018E8265B|nr:hypothetical protein [Alicyclobacillus sp. SO9]QQE78034.1 hypothetical protein GI364_19360 [Alicyclobacillus sp. SO9]